MLLGGAALAAVARRFGAPYPALVALAGAALALIPGLPTLALDPELTLALFVAPVLVDAAFDASPRDLRANWRPVASLALGAVALTIAVVALVAKLLVPDMPWGAAVALGAIVAPPDAAAATAVLKQPRPPNRLLVILEGESLFNDASALIAYRLPGGATLTGCLSRLTLVPTFLVGTPLTGFLSGWTVLPTLLVVPLGSVALGLALSRATVFVSRRIHDVATSVVFQFGWTFGVWILAEQLHLSGIITLVVFAMATSRTAAEIIPARIRIPAWAVWEVTVFVLNVLAFILLGFQLKSIAVRLTGSEGSRYAIVAAAVTGAVILARMAWVTGAAGFSRWRCRPQPSGKPGPNDAVALDRRSALLVGWCGMRGTVTIAAALALPIGFPYRDMILVTAFGVVLGTLVLQGLTLRPVLLALRLEDDGTVDHEVRLGPGEAVRAGLAAAECCEGAETAELVRHRYQLQLRRAEQEFAAEDADGRRVPSTPVSVEDAAVRDGDEAAVRAATDAQRKRLFELRADGTIGDAAFQRVEEELDWAELDWAQLLQAGQPVNGER